MLELIELEKTYCGFCAYIYNAKYNCYETRRLIGYSKTAAIRELRRNGIKCPKRTYNNF